MFCRKMIIGTLLMAVLLVSFGISDSEAQPAATLAYAHPSIEFVSETHDFGHIVPGEQAEYTFEFTNTGTEELIIERIESS